MKVALYAQAFPQDVLDYVLELLSQFDNEQVEVSIEKEAYAALKKHREIGERHTFTREEGLSPDFDLFISFGGDGTILRAITFIRDLGIPVVGVNTGRLGFLSTFRKEEVKQLVRQFIDKAYNVVPRTLVKVESDFEIPEFHDMDFALNEAAISRKDTTSMITIETYLNDEYLTSYWADGLIIATPTGSTGYSLSCGGPVLMPGVSSLVITPIAPHNLNARPLVIPDDTVIRLRVSGREPNHLVSLDSRLASIKNEREIRVRKADFKVGLIEFHSESFLRTIRNKLLWGQDRRN